MKRQEIRQTLASGAALALVLGTFAALVWLVAFAIREGATVVAATVAALATIGAAAVARNYERRKALEATRREHLGPLFEDLASVLAGQDMTDRKRVKVLVGFMRKSLVYASPATLKAFRVWHRGLDELERDESKPVQLANALRYEAFVMAMRADLGVSNRGLSEGDLARTALTDFDEYYFDTAPASIKPPEVEPRVHESAQRS
ncbi:MAG: hypothetical protein ACJ762_20315 [Solirubrobacteraceae bacterium]